MEKETQEVAAALFLELARQKALMVALYRTLGSEASFDALDAAYDEVAQGILLSYHKEMIKAGVSENVANLATNKALTHLKIPLGFPFRPPS